MTTQWEKVHVFISSTFNDMHAERDYLVKQVFPELREWCEKRKLSLVDIDLRWGVTEQDALHNKNVVKVCLDRIDDCRPFFLCFLGQRRGWVPKEDDISTATFEEFPGLKAYAGDSSVTEMEILHALVNPLHRGKIRDPKRPSEFYEPAKYAFFYLRDDSYLSQFPIEPPPPLQLRQTYTNEGIEDEEERAQHDIQLKQWREEKIPATGRPTRSYQATWDPHLITPELLLSLQCPSSEPTNIQRWKEQWAKAGVEVKGDDIEIDPAQVEKARAFNQRLITGRLKDFKYKDQPLNQVILHDLQAAITERYPDHVEGAEESDLQKEIDQQEHFLYTGSEGFISRGDDFAELNAYVDGDEKKLFVLTAPGGMGKSTLLAKWIEEYRKQHKGSPNQSIHFRFIGQSDRSTTVYSLLHFLMRELKELAGKISTDIPDDPQKLRQELLNLLEAAGKKGRTVIVLDALNQLESGLSDLSWLPTQLPENVKLVVSFKRGETYGEDLLQNLQGQAILAEVKPFADLDDRKKLVKTYLAQYLKDLDERHLETLIQSTGAENPLFLKVVLSELRVFGAFTNLGEKIRSDFGKTPVSAIEGVLKRLQNDPAYSPIDPKQAVPLLFGLLAHARQGLSLEELTSLFVQEFNKTSQDAQDTINLYLRQVRPFLAHREGRYDFFFESFKLAARELYLGEELPKRLAKDWHRLLAEYFSKQSLEVEQEGKSSPNLRKLMELPFQQAFGELGDDLTRTLTDYRFLETKIGGSGVQSLVDDYDLALKRNIFPTGDTSEGLGYLRRTLLLCSQILNQDRHELAGQLCGRLQELENPLIKDILSQASTKQDVLWLRPMTATLKPPVGAEEITIQKQRFNDSQAFSSLTITPDGKYIVLGDSSSHFEIINLNTGIKERSFQAMKQLPEPDQQKRIQVPINRNEQKAPIVFTPDGQKMVFVGDDGIVRVWNILSGKEENSFPGLYHWDFFDRARYPSADGLVVKDFDLSGAGRMTITGSADGSVDVWNNQTGRKEYSLGSHTCAIEVVQFSWNQDYAISLSEDGQLTWWNLANRKAEYQHQSQIGEIEKIGISLDNKNAIVICADNMVKIWNFPTGQAYSVQAPSKVSEAKISEALAGSSGDIYAFFSFEDKKIESVYWDLIAGQRVPTKNNLVRLSPFLFKKRFYKNKNYIQLQTPTPISLLSLTQDGNKVILGSSFMSVIQIRDIQTGLEESTLKLYDSLKWAGCSFDLAPDGRFAAVINGQTLKIFDLLSGQVMSTLNGINGQRVWLTANGQKAFVFSEKHFEIWNLVSSQKEKSIDDYTDLYIHGDNTYGRIAQDGRRAVFLKDKIISVWNLIDASKERDLIGHSETIKDIALTPDGHKALSLSGDGIVKVWNLESSESELKFPGHPREVTRVVITPDDQHAVTSCPYNGKNLIVWSMKNFKEERFLEDNQKHSSFADQIAISPDSRLMVAGFEGAFFILDLSTGNIIDCSSHTASPIQSLSITPDGQNAIAITADGITIRRLSDGKELNYVKTDFDHGWGNIRGFITSDCQAGILTSSQSGKAGIVVFDISTGKTLHEIEADNQRIFAYSPNGNFIIYTYKVSNDRIYRWNFSTGTTDLTITFPVYIAHIRNTPIVISPDSQYAFIPNNGAFIRKPDLNYESRNLIMCCKLSAGEEGMIFANESSPITGLFVMPDNKRLISITKDYALRVRSIENGQCLASFHAESEFSQIGVTSDCRTIVAGDKLGRVHFLRLEGYEKFGR